MGDLLCSSGLAEFMKSAELDCSDMSEMIKCITNNIPQAAEECNIGRVGIKIRFGGTPMVPAMNTNRDVYVNLDGYGDDTLTFEYNAYDSGSITIVCSPLKGHVFSDEESSAVRIIAQTCFLMTSRTRARKVLELAEVKDMLTGVYNIQGMFRYTSKLIAEKCFSDYCGIYLNIKHFKYINSRIGSRQSDDLLITYSSMIDKHLGKNGAVAHLGGDNFVILVLKSKMDDFMKFIRHVEIDVGPLTLNIEARMGIYEIKPTDSFRTMMNNVSVAIEHSSKTSTDTIWLSDTILSTMLHEKEISTSFSDAIANHEFIVYYQPKVDLNTNTLMGCEALSRWQKDGKVISPMSYIPILESDGSICKLDFYILEEVCKTLRKWLDSGLEPVCVSVNFSKIHFHDEKLAERIAGVLKKYDIDGKYVEAELTEMSGFEDVEALKRFIAEMHRNGIKTSIDDFGTGYSSLHLIKSLDVDVIKLDRSFVKSLEKHLRNDEIVVRNIVNMINELKMDIIAEGVETDEQANFLRQIHCFTAQGFLYDKPMPIDQFTERLKHKTYEK